MKNLWISLPPLLADNFGFIAALQNSDGCGVVDDSGEYRLNGSHDGHEEHGGHGGRGGRREGHRLPWEEGQRGDRPSRIGEGRGERRHGGKHGARSRIVVSSASSEDVVTGTRSRILQAFEEVKAQFDPKFALFSAGPCGAMIGTDLEEIAETVTRETGLPAAAVNLTGQKPYDTGLSKTMETMVKLLAKPMERETGTINLLGGTSLDWAETDVDQVKAWAEGQGIHVLAQLGDKITAAQMETMAKAQLNLVTAVSGLAAARYMEAQFGTPYIGITPFGQANCRQVLKALETGRCPESVCPQQTAEALIIGEQFTANAVRTALEDSGVVKAADVATFYTLDKAFARPKDKRIRSEEAARELLQNGGYRIILGDPLLRCFAPDGCKWVDLRHRAFNTYGEGNDAPALAAENLDRWLSQNI